MATLAESVGRRLASLGGLTLRPSRFGGGPSYWAGKGELLHFHGDSAVDLRLGRAEIRARRDRLSRDERVHLRKSASADWIEIRMGSRRDVKLVVELAKVAIAARARRDAPRDRQCDEG